MAKPPLRKPKKHGLRKINSVLTKHRRFKKYERFVYEQALELVDHLEKKPSWTLAFRSNTVPQFACEQIVHVAYEMAMRRGVDFPIAVEINGANLDLGGGQA